eukprot:GHVO01006519.1.p1 GENE.GHVO01006519.1~~GHVO01006519.1.p1  ORF type:complete len:112 (+),score=1.06 GHVO01006519.1:442-777(+)
MQLSAIANLYFIFSSLFWTDSESGLVERSDLKGDNRIIFVPKETGKLSALAIDGDKVYWVVQFHQTLGTAGKVYSSGVDGQNINRRLELSGFTFNLVAFDVYKVLVTVTDH